MDTAIRERSWRLLEGINRAIPALLAPGDFIGNVATSLRILAESLDLNMVFILASTAADGDDIGSAGDLQAQVVLERVRNSWQEVSLQHGKEQLLELREHAIQELLEQRAVAGTVGALFSKVDLDWAAKSEDQVRLLPLEANGIFHGALGLSVQHAFEDILALQQLLNTYTLTLAHCIERHIAFRQIRRERDQLRTAFNLAGPNVVEATGWADLEHSFRDLQLLNRKIISTIPDQVFIIDLQDHANFYSNKSTFLGHVLEDIEQPFAFFKQFIHPDDVEMAFGNSFEKLNAAADDEIIECEYRIFDKDGEIVWFNERVKVFKRDSEGKVWQYLSILEDISKRKDAQRLEEDSRRQYKNFVTYSTDGIYYMTCGVPIDIELPAEEQLRLYYDHAYISDANPAIAKMYSLEDESWLVGKTVMEVHKGEYLEKNQRSFLDLVENDYRIERVETIERAADGTIRYFENSAVGDIVDGKLVGMWGTQQDITAKREAEMAQVESETLFRNLFEKNPLGVVIGDAEGNLLRCNEHFAEIVGYSVEELNQMTFMDLTHPDEIKHEWEVVNKAMEDRLPLMFMEKRYIHRDGHVVWTNLNMSFVYNDDGTLRLVMGMIEDITEKRKIRLKLEQNEEFQKAILSTLPDLKFRINGEGIFVDHYSSPNNIQDLLVPPEEFLGKKLSDILPTYLAEATIKNIKKVFETGDLQTFEYMLPVRGDMLHFEMRLNAINEEEVIAVIRNVSERNWAQVELKNKIRELDEKNRQLKHYIDSNMQLENFAYIASHDLREPLRTMATFAQLLEKKYKDQLDETAKTYIEFVVQGARNLNNLIEDLLVYSRIQSQENRQETIILENLLREVMDGLKDNIEEQGAKVTFGRLPFEVKANPSRLKQLFQNLLANAVKFRKNDVTPEISVLCREDGSYWEFEVRDNGIGIDPEFHDKIFLLFKKLHSRKNFQGTGLGLAICKKVVEQMGGNIWLKSEAEKGASFFFTMPK